MKFPYEETTPESSKPRQREADMANRRQSPALCDSSDPRSVIRGESLQPQYRTRNTSHPFSAHTDWLACTFPIIDTPENIRELADYLGVCFGNSFGEMELNDRGINGWTRSYRIGSTKATFGIGGINQRGRGYLCFTAESCRQVSLKSWPAFIYLMTEVYTGRITRWDGAADDFEGLHDLQFAQNELKIGGFNTGGNKPTIRVAGDWLSESDTKGRTLYIGSRKNGKLLRIYEKGKQLGDPFSSWVRWEIELRRAGRDIPWRVLLYPGQYIAGAHKCMDWIDKETCRILTHQKQTEISETVLTKYCNLSYGKHIYTLMEKHKDPQKVLNMLKRRGTPERLSSPCPPD